MLRFLRIIVIVEIDVHRLESRVQKYVQSCDERITKEVKFLGSLQRDLIVSDIVPWVFHSANRLQIKSVLMTNFTWIEIYKEYLDLPLVKAYQDAYALANEVLIYELSGIRMKKQFIKYDKVSLCARPFDYVTVAKILSRYNQPLVFVSVGRSVELTEKIDVSNEPYHFIVTEGIQLVGENVTYLPKETPNTQDYILASEIVITKAKVGFGTLAEALLAKKKIAVIEWNRIADDRATAEWLVSRYLAWPVQYNGGLALSSILRNLEKWEPNYEDVHLSNDVDKVSRLLMQFAHENPGHRWISLTSYGKKEMGYLVPLDEGIPFVVKRIFYLTDIPKGVHRGRHAYYETKQVLICVSGEVKVKCQEGEREVTYYLKDNKQGLYLVPSVWREAYDFSQGAVLLVLSSKEYDEADAQMQNIL